ncbi:hypothetical protein FQA39_LY05196 [Lamprigera yunnana]|nr:hypothetical protein FQA39_LY05196 [Lamprigera yunnana]
MGIISWIESYGDEMFQNFDMSKLSRDEAYLTVNSNVTPLYLYSVYKECVECPYTKERDLENGNVLTISTRYSKLYRLSSATTVCDLDVDYGEFGVYSLNVPNNQSCHVEVLKEPVNIYFPIVTVLLIYGLLLLIGASIFYVSNVYLYKKKQQTSSHSVEPKQTTTGRNRVVSLDTFRGISIIIMIFANFGSGGYSLLDHIVWNGLHLADVVFPWFMWIMGVCVPISIGSALKRGILKRKIFINVLQRSCILFVLGLFLNASPNLEQMRIFGVLQRLGLAYFVVATCFLMFPNEFDKRERKNSVNIWRDVLAMKFQWIVALVVLAAHCLITFFVHAPNCESGYLGPGGLHKEGTYRGCVGGAAGYIDQLILGEHIYKYALITTIYKSEPFDPEGILGCLTSIVQVFIGSQVGATIIVYKSHLSRLLRWIIWGAGLGLVGGCLCGFSKDEGVIPINKHLWSVSFVLVTSSFAFLLFSVCYLLVDVKKIWSGKPFMFAGMNVTLMYVGHSLAFNHFPIRWVPDDRGLSTHFLTFFENIWGTACWLLIAYQLYRKKFFLSI